MQTDAVDGGQLVVLELVVDGKCEMCDAGDGVSHPHEQLGHLAVACQKLLLNGRSASACGQGQH